MKKTKQIIPLPFPVYFWTATALALAGLLDSIYMSTSHYRVYTDMGYRSFCAISKSINCDTVSQSIYSIFLGVPVPVWGIIGYAFFLLFLPFAWSKRAEKKRMWALLFFVSLAFSCCSIILALILTSYIHSYCIMCVLCYAINFMLLYYVWLIRRRFGETGLVNSLRQDIGFLWKDKTKAISLFSPFTLIVISTVIFFPGYWHFPPPPLSAEIPKGVTEDGHPWIGAENPELVITEFTDYQCFQCKKMHFFLRQIVAEHPDKIRLIHRHYPMDDKFNPIVKEPFHVGSGAMALLASYAATKGKFWEMNDVLFNIDREKGSINVKELSEKVGLDPKKLSWSIYDGKIRHKLKVDIWEGMKLGITGTPCYVIKGKLYLAQIPPNVINDVLE